LGFTDPSGGLLRPTLDKLSIQSALIAWFEDGKQELPWRQNRDAYRVWLSEVMLQQTQVETVIPYYLRFLKAFPSLSSLASAPLDQVLKAWEGLGYYSRARHLHRAAQIVVKQFQGQLPSTVDDLMRLPGIGRYTAGAIASLAFGVNAPLLDGNVIRVFSRLLDSDQDVTADETKRVLWQIAEQLLPAGKAGQWNEGLMELGRRVCTPKNPACDLCPLNGHCLARRAGVQAARPVKSPRKKTPHYEVAAGVIQDQAGHILIAQRPLEGMLGGLWEFPGGKREAGETLPECLRREIAEELGIDIEVGPQIVIIKHAYTHFRITLYAFLCRYVSGAPRTLGCAAWQWISQDDFDRYAFPVTDHKIIGNLRNGSQLGLDLQ
jgi:A/G-specific adenine glycosylase